MHPQPEIADHFETVETVPVDGGAGSEDGDGALVFTIHDGRFVPRHLFGERTEEVLNRPEIGAAYLKERDWGANLVARHLAREIGAGSYLRINLARVVMDFGRFPGASSVGEEYLRRHALFPPFEYLLGAEARHEILARYYDATSQAFVQHFAPRRLTVAIHSYDAYNPSGTLRPEVSLVTRSLEYQLSSTTPPYIFDPLFPPELCEATGCRLLTYRALADLEAGGWYTALNYPYIMPEGSVEIRAQVWLFFRYLRREFMAVHPGTAEDPAYQRVWQLLLDVVRRSADAERLRGYLHRYREAPEGLGELFAAARCAYREIARFVAERRGELMDGYGFDERLSCLGVEVRKDLLCEIDYRRRTIRPRADADDTARRIAAAIAPAVRAYLAEHAETPLEDAETARSDLLASSASVQAQARRGWGV